MRIAVVGGGIAGALLAWRLSARATSYPDVRIELIAGDGSADATGASGGAVRGYEPAPQQRRLAAASLRELLDSPVLRRWSGFERTRSVYVHDPSVQPVVDDIPDAELVPGEKLAGWRGLPEGAVAVVEHAAGHISPDRLRAAVLRDIAGRVRLVPGPLTALTAEPTGPVECTVAGQARGYDVVVLATGAWTPALLHDNGLPAEAYQTKSIRCAVYAQAGHWLPPAFVDETSGLYGKPTLDGGILIGVPTQRWGVPPGWSPTGAVEPAPTRAGPEMSADPTVSAEPDPVTAHRLAAARLPDLRLGRMLRQLDVSDCYTEPPVLQLRPVLDAERVLFTFSGGSGGAAKTALAASAQAAADLLDTLA